VWVQRRQSFGQPIVFSQKQRMHCRQTGLLTGPSVACRERAST
jgi:hypothetical protein